MNVYALGAFATFIVYIFVGNYAGRKVKNIEDYYVYGRNAPTVLIVGTLVASFLSTVCFMGETGFAYDGYVVPLLFLCGLNACGYTVGVLFFGRFLRRSNALTVCEYFGQRFNSRTVQVVAGITTVIGIGGYLVAVCQGASILMSELLGVSYGVALIIVWLVYTSFTFYSGSKGVLITDTIMFLFFTIATFMAAPVILKCTAGGWSSAIEQLAVFAQKPGIVAFHGLTGSNALWSTPLETIFWAVTMGIVWGLVVAVSPWQSSRYLMAKNEHVAIRAAMFAGITYLLIYVILHFSAASINLLNPNIMPSEKAFIWGVFNILPTWMGVIVLGGIMAAALSSCSTFLSLVGFSVSRDIMHGSGDNLKSLRTSRMIMLGVGLVSLIITYFQTPAVMWIGYFAATLFAASWGPVAFMSVWSKRITAPAATVGILGGFCAVLVCESLNKFVGVSFPFYFSPPIIGGLFSLISVWVVSSMTTVTEAEKAYRAKLFVVPEEELDLKEIKRTKCYSKVILGIAIVTFVFLYLMYVVPYSTAV
ncbi:MAG: sodium:solute symporter family protein [Bacillota bacterium]|jgi:Na+/proline symporter